MADTPTSPAGPFDPPAPPNAPSALARLPVGRHGLPREFIEENQRNRLMAAALDAFAGRGYGETSIARIIGAAGVSRHTFYAHFADKEACFLATYDVAITWLAEKATAAAGDVDGWAARTVAVIDSLLCRFHADPRLARLCVLEVHHAGDAAAERHRETIDRLATALRACRPLAPRGAELPPLLEPFLVGGAIWLAVDRLAVGEADRLADLGPEIAEIILTPYLGSAAARDLLSTAGQNLTSESDRHRHTA